MPPFNISAMAKASEFKFGVQLGFVKPIIKLHPEKSGRGPGLVQLPKIFGPPSIFLQWLKLANSNLVYSLGLLRPIIKSHPAENVGWPWARELPKIWGSL